MSLRAHLHTFLPLTLGLCLAGAVVACDGLLGVDFDDANRAQTADGGDGDSGPDGDAAPNPDDPDMPLVPASKVDLLLVVDNSASMGDKAQLLASSIGTLIRDVARVGDLHVGVISSSLGNFGGDVCAAGNPRTNDRGHLRTLGADGKALASASAGFLSYKGGDVEAIVKDTESLVRGVGETGCGLEAQLEAAYRFLVQPDPWVSVTINKSNQAQLGDDIDVELLQQRSRFLRPDSAVVVVMLTDEDDSAVDPLAVGGQGWTYMTKNFPGSQVFRPGSGQGTTAPRGTSICKTDPASPDCTSCGFQTSCEPSDPACQKIKADPDCRTSGVQGKSGGGYDGYYGPMEDELNVRFHRMKERFGVDPQYPIARYVTGFTASKVPDRKSEHTIETTSSGRLTIGPYVGTPKCTNPLFAAALPSQLGDEICALPRGPRSRELVLFAVLGGVPEGLATENPNWTAILGTNPDSFDYTGIDPHMIQSIVPRPGLALPSSQIGNNGNDPVHGREWDTMGADLQYACTFQLEVPRTCSVSDPSCECRPDAVTNPPLCAPNNQQVRGKAYPTSRPLRVARGLGERAVVGSICASLGYDATMMNLAKRLAPRLAL